METQVKNLTLAEIDEGKIVEVHATGKLEKSDYESFDPEVERLIEKHGKTRVLFVMRDFHGWTTGGLWEDIKFDASHFKDIERLALVGDSKWEEWMASFCKPFTTAKIKYFPTDKLSDARDWIRG